MKPMKAVLGSSLTILCSSLALGAGGLPAFQPVPGVSGTLKAIGSDSMNNLIALWTEDFRKIYPGVTIEVEGKGSQTAPPALINGTAQLGPMSRPMKSEEIASFKKKYGYDPTAVKTSIDVLSVFVHRDNPLASLSMEQVDAIFSKTLKGGQAKSIEKWGDLGLKGEWANRPIQIYGRNSASGTYAFFKDHALFKGDFKDSVKEQPGSAAVVQAVTSDRFGIGYSGFGYVTAGVKALPLSLKDKAPVAPNRESAYSGSYPLARFLLLYVNKSPTEKMEPLRQQFLRFVLSAQGQDEVTKEGYIPLTPKIASEERAKLGIGE